MGVNNSLSCLGWNKIWRKFAKMFLLFNKNFFVWNGSRLELIAHLRLFLVKIALSLDIFVKRSDPSDYFTLCARNLDTNPSKIMTGLIQRNLTLPLTAYWNLVILQGGASEAPPKISRKESSLTPCCYIVFV